MKNTPLTTLLLLGLLLSAGCKTRNYGTTPLGDTINRGSGSGSMLADAPPASPLEPVIGTNESIATNSRQSHDGWKENLALFEAYTVHFDYDSSILKGSEKTKIEAVASQLKSNPAIAIKIRGHCDERGTEEYNRSLGERRALALREELVRLGIDPSRMDTISFGDAQPLSVAHNESAWKQNRRGEFVELTPP
jgi:peptidoglycan-associated lipoprotein